MLRSASLVVAMSLVCSAGARADDVPRLDIESTCRAAGPLNSGDANPYQNCMRSEQDARAQLGNRWNGVKETSRNTCLQETNIGGRPSYVELLTCVEMYEGTLTPNGGTTAADAPSTVSGARRRQPSDAPAR